MYDDPTWGVRLDLWRAGYRRLQRDELAAWDKRGEDETRVRRLRKELQEAEATFAKADAEANDLMRRREEMLCDGQKQGFRP